MADSVNDNLSNLSFNRCEDLYFDAMKRKERHDKIYSKCLDQECTFKPDIGINKYQNLNKSESVIDRLSNPNYSVKEQAVVRKITNENFDPKTG